MDYARVEEALLNGFRRRFRDPAIAVIGFLQKFAQLRRALPHDFEHVFDFAFAHGPGELTFVVLQECSFAGPDGRASRDPKGTLVEFDVFVIQKQGVRNAYLDRLGRFLGK